MKNMSARIPWRIVTTIVLSGLIAALAAGCVSSDRHSSKSRNADARKADTIRVGYFPNITHSQAIVGLKKGEFAKALGSDIKIDKKVFKAGPEEIEALFAGEIDLGYIGPGPAVNAYIKSHGEALRVVAGATSGGAVFVSRKDSGIKSAKDLRGKRISSPKLGNTQDIALRTYLKNNGLKTKQEGGDVDIQPVDNPDILVLFQKKVIDGAWVPEPWGARLVIEGNGEIFLDEREIWPGGKFSTTNVIVSKKFLDEHPEIVQKWLEGHVAATQWINENKDEAKTVLNDGIEELTGKSLPEEVINEAFERLEVTWDPVQNSLFKGAKDAHELKFISSSDVGGIYDLGPLNRVLAGKKLKSVSPEKQ